MAVPFGETLAALTRTSAPLPPPATTVLLLGSGPLIERLATTLGSRAWVATRAGDAGGSLEALRRAPPRAILLHPVDLSEATSLLGEVARVESARGIPVLAVLAESPLDPEELPPGADAYLIDPSPDDLFEALAQHVLTAWSRAVGAQQALDIIESLDDAVLVVDRAHRVVYHNPRGLALVQRTSRRSGTLLGALVERAMPDMGEPATQKALQAALEHAETSHLERPVGALWLSFDVFPNPDGATIVSRDITQRHELEASLLDARARLARSEKAAFLGELVQGIAHEVRTPLVYLGNNLELIRADMRRFTAAPTAEAAKKIDQDIDEAWAAWERAVRIMKELQRITRMDPTVRTRTDLASSLRDAITLFVAAAGKGARVEADLEAGLYVHADGRKLQQVVLNLLQNAVDASGGTGGTRRTIEGVRVTTRRGIDGVAELVVRDMGAGMTAEVLDRMYDPLFTTKKDGMGLGLGIVQRAVSEHGGSIACESAPGRGTTFTIRFPLMKEDDV